MPIETHTVNYVSARMIYRWYIHEYIHTWIHTYIHSNFIHTHICIYRCRFILVPTDLLIDLSMVHTHMHTYIHTYINTYIHKYIHTIMHTYVHTNVNIYIHANIKTYIRMITPLSIVGSINVTYIHKYTHIYIITLRKALERESDTCCYMSYLLLWSIDWLINVICKHIYMQTHDHTEQGVGARKWHLLRHIIQDGEDS